MSNLICEICNQPVYLVERMNESHMVITGPNHLDTIVYYHEDCRKNETGEEKIARYKRKMRENREGSQ